ncbi:Sodium/hydrogen exchanger family-domain-containing protein [Polychytrium aggregatum]|uniref:Sodium/hydrogen exchanger family-domain-containing protein n=1 Tax=Polychytrium aggregatum TaxID=110093 RepID=UPI0022FE55AE|nr:Sodium/hydrogen exchanger family-domain-containing protein [Polychytrium aggregatum]KAI9209697.1 Sodium/hydrogen exchanger family-domain-containing protein [Polychytrium aggregatum]
MTASAGTIFSGLSPLVDPVGLFLIQALIIIAFSRALAAPLAYLKLPKVLAEIIVGIILGPSALSSIPAFANNVFPAASLPPLQLAADFGLIFYFFLIGVELDVRNLFKNKRSAAIVSFSGIILTFVISIGASKALYDNLMPIGTTIPFVSFLFFIGVATSITAFPVLVRIISEGKLMSNKIGQLTLAAAQVDDAFAWGVLIYIIAWINNTNNPVKALATTGCIVAWGLVLWFIIRPIFERWIRHSDSSDVVSQFMVFVTFILVSISASFASMMGSHAIFGAFFVGLIIPHGHGFALNLTEKIEDIITVIFLPLYFAYSGFNTRFDYLNNGTIWGMVVLVTVVACFGKIVGCMSAAKFLGLTVRESFAVGILMNTKGLVELIVLNLGLQSGVISVQVFTVMVVMAVITTAVTGPLLSIVYPTSLYGRGSSTSRLSLPPTNEGAAKPGSIQWKNHLQILVALPNMHVVPSMMAVSEMIQNKLNPLTIHALRLIQLNDRTSSLLMASELDQTLRNDAILNVFRTFGTLYGLPVNPLVAVSHTDEFAEYIVSSAIDTQANLIIVPWHPHSNDDVADGFEDDGLSKRDVAEAIVNQSPCSVAIFVDRGFGGFSRIGQTNDVVSQSVYVLYFGESGDDHEALLFTSYLSAHVELNICILRISDQKDPAQIAAAGASQITVNKDVGEDSQPGRIRSCTQIIESLAIKANVKIEDLTSSTPVGAIVDRLAGNLSHHDLVVVGDSNYKTRGGINEKKLLRNWVNRELKASSVVVSESKIIEKI